MSLVGHAGGQQRAVFRGREHGDHDVAGCQFGGERGERVRAGFGAAGEAEGREALGRPFLGAVPQAYAVGGVAQRGQAAARGQARADPVDGAGRGHGGIRLLSHG